jgi:uncharacterized protein
VTLDNVVQIVLSEFPATQAIYLFGSFATAGEWPDSDIDIALLLPAALAKQSGSLGMSELRFKLEDALKKPVDLINLRQVSTVFQKEIIMADRRIYCADLNAADEFEMLVLSLYGKLNEERRDILEEGLRSGRFYDV